MVLFAGLIVHTLFSDVINRALQLVLGNVNYVKKVVFPLEILPAVQLLSATFHALVSVVVLIAAQLALFKAACRSPHCCCLWCCYRFCC